MGSVTQMKFYQISSGTSLHKQYTKVDTWQSLDQSLKRIFDIDSFCGTKNRHVQRWVEG